MRRERTNGYFFLFRRAYSLKWKLWQYFVLFAFVILCLFYGLQMVLVQAFYRYTKETEMINASSVIETSYASPSFEPNSFLSLLINVADDSMLCIEVVTWGGEPLYSVHRLASCVLHEGANDTKVTEMIEQVRLNAKHKYLGNVVGGRFQNQLLAYGTAVHGANGHEAVLLINAEMGPMSDMMDIFRQQMLAMSLLVVVLSTILSMFPAQLVSQPLARMTQGAKELAKGNFNVRFDAGEYAELNELSETLNYAAEGLGAVDAVRKDLIANVSHDLRTPLTMIKAYAEMVRDLSGDNPEKRSAHVSVIIEESDRLARLVNDLLDLSRLQNNAMVIQKRAFDVAKMVAEILKRYTILTEQEGYAFEQEGPASLYVSGNPQRIEQVLYNLINNAVQYSGQNKRVCVRLLQWGGMVRVEVQDWGEGIAPEQLKHIWERYYKVDKTHKRPVVGTGLGLSIVKAALEQHGAVYGVTSEVDRGSLFYFELPLAAGEQALGLEEALDAGDEEKA